MEIGGRPGAIPDQKGEMMSRLLGHGINIEVTNACNLACYSCTSWKSNPDIGFMSVDTFKHALDLVLEHQDIKKVQLYWRGDACLHPKLPEMAEILKDRGLKGSVATNSSIQNLGRTEYIEKLLKNLHVYTMCIDGWNQETISKYRVGSNFELVMANLKAASKVVTECRKRIKVLMFKYNDDHEDFFLELGEKYGFEVLFIAPTILGKFALTPAEADEWLSENKRFRRYRPGHADEIPKGFTWRGKPVEIEGEIWVHQSSNLCEKGSITIAHDGSIPLCGQDTKLGWSLGNIFVDDFNEIMAKYNSYSNMMYNRTMPLCNNWCLCSQSGSRVR